MLSQKHRLSKSADVKKTTARGRGFFNTYFVIKSLSKEGDPRCTVIVSNKVSKKAVDRNRLKRIVREEIRKQLPHMKPGDYAILMKASALKIPAVQLREAIQQSLIASKIVKAML